MNGTIPAFTSVAVNPETDLRSYDDTVRPTRIFAFDRSQITFDSSQIFIGLQSTSFDKSGVLVLDIDAPAVAAPEPGTLALAATALPLGQIARRRRRRAGGRRPPIGRGRRIAVADPVCRRSGAK